MTARLTAQQRREVCVHEAAHAVVHALGGVWVYGLGVAPEGASDWETEDRKGYLMADLWGCCHTSDAPVWRFIQWDDEGFGGYNSDWKGYADLLRQLDKHQRGSSAAQLRELRAHICGTLAGPIADAIREGRPEGGICLGLYDSGEFDDVTKAEAFCCLLPFYEEFHHLATETERILRVPETWQVVMHLADALEAAGTLKEELRDFLPASRRSWPPSSPMKRRKE